MRKSSTTGQSEIKADWSTYIGISLLCPLLALYVLYLTAGYLMNLHLSPAPDFWSQSILKTNLVCYGPALLMFSLFGNLKLYFPHLTPDIIKLRVTAIVGWLTLALILAANTLLLVLHFGFFSADRYIRCWEPFPWETWHYAKTAEICKQHGLAPVQFLRHRNSAKNV